MDPPPTPPRRGVLALEEVVGKRIQALNNKCEKYEKKI